jgi:hypothetical protein
VPYQHALETEAGQHPMHLYLQGLLSHLQRKMPRKLRRGSMSSDRSSKTLSVPRRGTTGRW